MRNARFKNGMWHFRMIGAGFPSTGMIGVLVLLTIWLLPLWGIRILRALHWEGDLGPWVLILFTIAFAFGVLVSFLFPRGLLARYETRIALDDQKIIGYDRWSKQILWESLYNPNYLYLAETRVRGRHGFHPRLALVYGDHQQALVKYDIPKPDITMLTMGSRQDIQTIASKLGKQIINTS
ncbi:MAG: hypothetical protein GY845_30545 [Planctomycetes bacterium]|nr:hypothetical protein [Planctomycetota bacterium]